MIEADEEERSMRRMSRMRKMRMTTALTTTTVMNDEKELSALPTEVRSAQLSRFHCNWVSFHCIWVFALYAIAASMFMDNVCGNDGSAIQ